MPKELFCIRIEDEVIAAPTLAKADDASQEYNRHNPGTKAHHDYWPHGSESHAFELGKWPGSEWALLAAMGRRARVSIK